MLKTKVFENYRKFDKDDGFVTKVLCDLCKKSTEQYLEIIEDVMYDPKFILICKGCLTRGIEKLDKKFIEKQIQEEIKMNIQDKISKYIGEAMSGDDQIESFFAACKKKWKKNTEERVWEWADGGPDSAVGKVAKKFGLSDDEVRDEMLELEIVNPDGEIEGTF